MNPRRILRPLGLSAILLVAASCASRETNEKRAGKATMERDESISVASDEATEELREEERAPRAIPLSQLVAGNNRFAFDLLKQVGPGDVAFSPYAVSVAGMMVESAAGGPTKDALRSTLRISVPDEALEAKVRSLREGLAAGGSRGFEPRVVHHLWLSEEIAPEPAWNNRIAAWGGTLESVPFDDDAELHSMIDRAMSAATSSAIRKPTDSIELKGNLVASVGADPRGAWEVPFERAQTTTSTFTTLEGTKENRTTMRGSGRFRYFRDGSAEVIELPYEGNTDAVVILPREGMFEQVEGSLSYDRFKWYLGQLKSTDIALRIPKFELTSRLDMRPVLTSMGAGAAFESSADFEPGMGARTAPLGSFIHVTNFSLDEDGTRTQARGVVGEPVESATQFEASRPFLVIVRDRSTGQILVVARVT